MENIEKIKPSGLFTNYIYKTIPLAFDESMSYYETLCALLKRLKTDEDVINNNANVLIELQDFVTHYFDNLDVQEEINNKLDEMAESGELTEIIAQYLQLAGLLCYNTKADLKSAQNLSEGSFTKTFGTNTYNDGKGEFYKIRTLINTDIIDDDNLLSLSNYPTLVAEKMTDFKINQINNKLILMNSKKYLFVGDSYATGYQGSGIEHIEGYFTKVKNDLNLDSQIVADEGYGLIGLNGNLKWKDLIQNTTINNKETFTDIIICGGMNDKDYIDNIPTAMTELVTYLKTNFINATIHFGMVGKFKQNGSESELTKIRELKRAYNINSVVNKCKYIENSNLILHNIDWFISDNVHPNTTGQNQLAYCIKQYILNNHINDLMAISSNMDYEVDVITPSENVDLEYFQMYSYINKNNTGIIIAGLINFPNNLAVYDNTDFIIGKLTKSYLCASAYTQGLYFQTNVQLKVNGTINGADYCRMAVRLYNDKENNLHMKFINDLDNGNHLVQLSVNRITFYGTVSTIIDSNLC